MPKTRKVGWFVEVPEDLKKRFKELYPGRAAMRKLTIAAIEWAITERPKLKPPAVPGGEPKSEN